MQQKTIQTLSMALFVSLLVWGLYTFIVYLGIPVHGSVLLSDEAQQKIAQVCESYEYFCRGIRSIVPFLEFTFIKAEPFYLYVLFSAILYALFLGWRYLRTSTLRVRFTLTPLRVFLLSLLSLWLVFTTLSVLEKTDAQGRDSPVFRRLFEPLPQVYDQLGAEALRDLQQNFQSLQERGCLTYFAHTTSGAGVYDLKVSCMQAAFLSRVLPHVLFVLLFLFECLVLGRMLLFLWHFRPKSLLLESLVSAGVGACAWIVILWTLAVLSILWTSVGWLLVLGIPILGYRHSLYWVRQFFTRRWIIEQPWWSPQLLLAWLLLSYLALNFLNVVRPFPIGWDDLGSYLNRPRLMVSYGHFVYSMAQFQWEYLTSSGFLLFGYDSFFGATASMMINWTAGLLAVFAVFTFVRVFLGSGSGILAAFLYYILPLVGHFSYADMKIDNAVFTMGALATLALFLYLFPVADEGQQEQTGHWKWLALAGVFGGFAFAMKPTAVMVLMALGAILLGVKLHWSAFLGVMLFGVVVFVLKGVLNLRSIAERILGDGTTLNTTIVLLLFLLIGALLLGWALWRNHERVLPVLTSVGIFAAAFLLSIAPWVAYNNFQYGNVIPRLETGAPNKLSPSIALAGRERVRDFGQDIRVLPPELAIDFQHQACRATGSKEELDRYWGFRQGWRHYLTLPWRSVMNIDSPGYYVTTMPALLLFPFLLLLPAFWTTRMRWFRWLFTGTLFMLAQWMFLANGIPWYGLGIFLGLVVGLEVLLARAPDLPNRILASLLIVGSILVGYSNRFWQFEIQRNLFEYAFGKITAQALQERTIPHYDDIASIAIARHLALPDRPYLYRVGTFIPYFVPRNLEIIGIADHQVDVFNCLYQERDDALTLKRLKALGFNGIIFDTNTATIERNVGGTLHKKVQSFVDFLNNPKLGFQIVVNDPEAGVAYVLIP